MSLPTTPLAYVDAYDALDRAIADPKGIRIKMDDYDAAVHFRMRCHQARSIDRNKNTMTYDHGHPLHGASQYDPLVLQVRSEGDYVWLYFVKMDTIPGTVESLSGSEIVEPVHEELEPVPEPAAPPTTDDALAEAFEEVPAVQPLARRV